MEEKVDNFVALMTITTTTTITLVLASVMIMILSRKIRRQKAKETTEWPAGPPKLPIIGNLHQLAKGGNQLHVTMAKLAEEHGDVMTIWMGSRHPVIVLSGPDGVWEVLVTRSSDYASRYFPLIPKSIQDNIHTISVSDPGPLWNSLRKGLTGGAFSPFNLSAHAQVRESYVMDMIRSLMGDASTNAGIVEPYPLLRRVMIRTVARLAFGSDPKDEKFVEKMENLVEDAIHLSSFWARSVLVFDFVFADIIPSGVDDDFARRTEAVVCSYLSSPPPPNCFLHFLQTQNMSHKDMMLTVLEMFVLSVDSTALITTWALAFLTRDPVIQDKLYEEVNRSEIVSVEEVNKLPYLQAVVKETLRMKPVAPLGVGHKASKDTSVAGFKVAKDTPVWTNIYKLQHDPALWTEPDRFMPERFLLGGGINDDHQRSFLPFGAGMRSCVGGEVGKSQVALSLANLVRAFKWVPAVDGQLPDGAEFLLPVNNILTMKTPLVARIVPRHQLAA